MRKGNVTAGDRPYHHGDLHRAIVSAALEVLSETQSTEFSLRELARRAGVTHNAPYKHFTDKRELLAAVSAVGFELLAKRLTDAMKGHTSPRARLFAIARDYVRHGVENPALYRLMFGGYLTGPDDDRPAIEIAAAERTKALLADAIADGALGRSLPKTLRNERKIASAILIFWSLMHGLTLLLVDRLVGPHQKSDELSESVLQGMLEGLTTRIPALSRDAWVGPREPTKSKVPRVRPTL
jgi:AcrR family transcriptional regulator